jgi:BirA family biotin operon repressor/biotin-[acetyl-CoA-carboxylase] ligase
VELAAALLKSLDREYRAFVADLDVARREVLRRFELHSSYVRGRAVEVDEDGGYQGITAGMDARGFLQVRTEAGMKTVLSGGVRPK